jgi:ADP-ribose pyrophosphatase
MFQIIKTTKGVPLPKTDLNRRLLYGGSVLRLVEETVRLENGVAAKMEVIEHPGSTGIIPFLDQSEIVLLRQYRHPLKKHVWEIPAGTLAVGESPLSCALRELTEETGYRAGKWRKLGNIFPAPGYSSEKMHLFMAADLRAARQRLDADEIIAVETVALKKALDMIEKGDIQDAKTIAGLYLAKIWLARHPASLFGGPAGSEDNPLKG